MAASRGWLRARGSSVPGSPSRVLLQDQGGAAMPGAERAAGAVGETQPAVLHLHLRMGFAAELTHRLHHFGQAAPVRRVVVAEATAVSVEGQSSRARDEIAVGHELSPLPLGAEAEILQR